jgi:predicted TIM-barrel fold metal-dependent hydrolase
MRLAITCVLLIQCCILASAVHADDVKKTDVYGRIKASIDAVPAIDTHDHLRPFEQIGPRDKTEQGEGITLHTIWAGSYFPWIHPLEPWPKDGSFDAWWSKARDNFANARATSFYRYLLPAFGDLYGVDFDTITDQQARALNGKIFENYKTDKWLKEVITERANIELMVIDAHWARLDFATHYPFTVALCNVTSVVDGFHPSEFKNPLDDPYAFAARQQMQINSLDDYLAVLDRVAATAKQAGAICLKSTLAYLRTLRFENVPKERAVAIFGRPRKELTAQDVRDFEDFIMWRLVELSAKHDLPFQIHTGQAKIQGSNPILLAELIEANPKTKFVLFHGGFPWVGETGVIAMRFRNVWIDSVWMPTLSYTMAKRAYQEWLEAVPSNRIMWGSDTGTAEGIYGATVFARQCLAEALAEKVIRGELREADALRIGRQVMRENALELFPQLKERLWRK